MDFRYRKATIRFCLDLTDPRAQSVPVAVFMAGEADGRRIAALATRLEHPIEKMVDEITQEILRELPTILRAQVNEIYNAVRVSTLDDLFFSVCDSFRSSLYLSDATEVRVLKLQDATPADERGRRKFVMAAVHDVLDTAIMEADEEIEHFLEDTDPGLLEGDAEGYEHQIWNCRRQETNAATCLTAK